VDCRWHGRSCQGKGINNNVVVRISVAGSPVTSPSHHLSSELKASSATNVLTTLLSPERQRCFQSNPETMSANRYCEPCDRFLRGEITITIQEKNQVTFEHHRDFQSFDTALRLQCAICSLAWTYAKSLPSMNHWIGMLGVYSFWPGERDLKFCSEGQERLYFSDSLSLEPCQGN
jgi:hypothetical protein